MDTNLSIFSGRIGKEPTFLYSSRGHAMLAFKLAVHRRSTRGGLITSWVPILVWGKLAEALLNKLAKGKKVLVIGSLETPPKIMGELPEGHYPLELIVHKLTILGEGDFVSGSEETGEAEP
jgi:hypothetical protein